MSEGEDDDDIVGNGDPTSRQLILETLKNVSEDEIEGLKDVFTVIKHSQWAQLAAVKKAVAPVWRV